RRFAMASQNSIRNVTIDDSEPSDAEIITVRPHSSVMTERQRLPYFVGVSRTTAGSNHLAMNLVVIPPGAEAEPHYHRGYETAIYILKGRIEVRYGIGLKKTVVHEAGDFVFVPPNVPHQPFNTSKTEAAHAIVARTDANEQESVVL